jgi:hypothetical protein
LRPDPDTIHLFLKLGNGKLQERLSKNLILDTFLIKLSSSLSTL